MVTRRSDPDSADPPDEGAPREALAHSEANVEELSARLDGLVAEGRDFLTEAAHTIRGALTITHSYLEIVHHDLSEGLSEEQRSFVRIAYENAEKLRLLVEDLVELASLETGAARVDLAPTQVNRVIDDVHRECLSSAEEKGVGLTTELGENLPETTVDSRRLHDVICRLIDNAVRFTPQGGSVSVRSSGDNDVVVIEIEDNGVGIPANRIGECLMAFGQAHRKPGENRVGYGLGLPLSRLQVEAFGGTLTIESVENQGTNATIRLPAS
jgi:signal transduction histidine kinase